MPPKVPPPGKPLLAPDVPSLGAKLSSRGPKSSRSDKSSRKPSATPTKLQRSPDFPSRSPRRPVSARRLSSITDIAGAEQETGFGAWKLERYMPVPSKEKDNPAIQIPEKRSSHWMVFWENKLFSFSGVTDDYGDFTVHCYEVDSGAWKLLSPEGKIPPSRTGFTIAQYNNSVYIYGGSKESNIYGDIYEYRLDTNTWQLVICRTRNNPRKRFTHAMAVDADVAYVFGGALKTGFLNDFWMLDFTGRTWKELLADVDDENIPEPRAHHSMTVWEGKVYVFGGYNGCRCLNDLWVYEGKDSFEFGDWRQIIPPQAHPSPTPRMNHSACVLSDGRIVIFGGCNWSFFNEMWLFDTSKDVPNNKNFADVPKWELLPPKGSLPCPRANVAMAMDPDKGRVFIFGGVHFHTKFNDMYSVQFDVLPMQKVTVNRISRRKSNRSPSMASQRKRSTRMSAAFGSASEILVGSSPTSPTTPTSPLSPIVPSNDFSS